jgi:hypothetical protein
LRNPSVPTGRCGRLHAQANLFPVHVIVDIGRPPLNLSLERVTVASPALFSVLDVCADALKAAVRDRLHGRPLAPQRAVDVTKPPGASSAGGKIDPKAIVGRIAGRRGTFDFGRRRQSLRPAHRKGRGFGVVIGGSADDLT